MSQFRWPWEPREVAAVVRAACPSCDCTVGVVSFPATYSGGDGQKVVSTPAGVVRKCCGCGKVYTVLTDGSVLQSKRQEAPTPSRVDKAIQRSRALDDDLETLLP